ncbi:MAG: PorT family protein [Bacteroidales bacterium]|nr:PorT family protein [Bacteroidales bacterium]
MKKAFLLTSLIIFMATAALQAQVVKSIGLQPGIVWAKQSRDYKDISIEDYLSYRTGFHMGVNLEFLQHEYFSILAEGGFIQKGNKMEVNVSTPEGLLTGETKIFKTSIKYAYLSPMFKLRKEFGGFVPYLFAGPRIDYQLSYTSDLLAGLENDLNKLIFGLSYGLGLEYMFGPVGVAAVFQHQYDLSKLYNKEAVEGEYTGLSIKNNAFVLDLGVRFYLGKDE